MRSFCRILINSSKFYFTFLAASFGFVLISSTASAQQSLDGASTEITFGSYTGTDDDITPGSFTGAGFAPDPTEGQLDSDIWSIDGMSQGLCDFGDTCIESDFLGAGTPPEPNDGSTTAGGISAWDLRLAPDAPAQNIAFGVQPSSSDFFPGNIIMKLKNNTGKTITDFTSILNLYIWERNGTTRVATWIPELYTTSNPVWNVADTSSHPSGFKSPAFDAGQVWSLHTLTDTWSGLNIADQDEFFLRFRCENVSGSGSRDKFGMQKIVFNVTTAECENDSPDCDDNPNGRVCNNNTCSCLGNGDCDENTNGAVCDSVNNICICTIDDDCTGANNVCDIPNEICVECLDNADCNYCTNGDTCNNNICVTGTGNPCAADEVCDPDNASCVECLNDSPDCDSNPNGRVCDVTNNICSCSGNGDCDVNTHGAVCTGNKCSCSGDPDCVGNTNGANCDTDNNICVECLDNADCNYCTNGDTCDGNNTCVSGSGDPCTTPEKPECDPTTATCVECLNSGDCDGNQNGTVCDTGNNICICTGDGDCTGAYNVCDIPNKICVECLDNADCNYCTNGDTCNNNICVTGTGNPCAADKVCDPDNATCVECLQDSPDCDGNPNGNVCDTDNNICICSDVNDCADDGLNCNGSTTCTNNTCGVGTIPCVGTDNPGCLEPGNCVQCTNNDHCLNHTNGGICDTTNYVCIGCTSNDECDDKVACNGLETCDTLNTKMCLPGATTCSNPTPVCDTVNDVCVTCAVADDCDDDIACNGTETCDGNNQCQPGTATCSGATPVCDTVNDDCVECVLNTDCPTDTPVCDISTNECISCTINSDCDDGQFCNGPETCDTVNGGCVAGTPPEINDNVDCTVDACDEVNDVVTRTPNHNACNDNDECTSNTCDPTLGCQTTATGCTINNSCYADDTVNPQNSCEVCDASKNTVNWSARAAGEECAQPTCNNDGDLVGASTCNANGVCIAPEPTPCKEGCDNQECLGGTVDTNTQISIGNVGCECNSLPPSTWLLFSLLGLLRIRRKK